MADYPEKFIILSAITAMIEDGEACLVINDAMLKAGIDGIVESSFQRGWKKKKEDNARAISDLLDENEKLRRRCTQLENELKEMANDNSSANNSRK